MVGQKFVQGAESFGWTIVALAGIEARTFNGDVTEDRPVSNLPAPFATKLSITARTAGMFDTKRFALRGNNFPLDAQKNGFAFLYGQADVTSSLNALGECGDPIGLAGPKLHIWASSGTVHERYVSEFCRYITTFSAGILNPRPSETRSVLIGYFGLLGLIATIR